MSDKLIKILEKNETGDDDAISNIIVSDHENDECETITNEDEDQMTEFIIDGTESNEEEIALFNCNVCKIDFESIDDHLQKYHSNQDVIVDIDDNKEDLSETFLCNKCNEQFNSLLSLSTHIRALHEERVSIRRPAKKNTEKMVKIAKDEIEIFEEDNFCHICNTAFGTAKSYKLHVRMHNKTKVKTSDEPNEHDSNVMPIDDDLQEKFYCNICDKYYLKNYEEIHMRMHNGEEKFNCKICNKLFPNEAAIKMHMNAHQEPRIIRQKVDSSNYKISYACQYCGKEFGRPHEKVKHERVHTGERPYECEICGKCFRVSYCLTIHMRTHTDARPYVCPHCNKRFKAPSVYNHHLLIHSDERNYKCPYCPKKFKTSVQLSGHKYSHTKPFVCTECNRPFGSMYAVRTHMETHKSVSNNMKYSCEFCGAKYARKFALHDHLAEIHKDMQSTQVETSQIKKKPAIKKGKKEKIATNVKMEQAISIDDDGDPLLLDVVEQEVTISEIDHFEAEDEVVNIDWYK